jgi:transcriptional regulator with XRE-family HTH domain
MMLSRSLRVKPECIESTRMEADRLFPSRGALVKASGKSPSTVSNYLTGKPVDYSSFEAISTCLKLDWEDIKCSDEDDETPVPVFLDEDKKDVEAEFDKDQDLKKLELGSGTLKQSQTSGVVNVNPCGERSIAVGGNASGNIVTGDGNVIL